MPGRMEFQSTLPTSVSTPARHDPNTPPRILIMADFSGRGQREASSTTLVDLADRPLLRVDVDNLNAVMARLAPKLRLPPNVETGGTTTAVSFAQIDDFHPDALYRRLEIFQILRRTRARLLNPVSFAQAVAELSPSPATEPVQSEPTAVGDNDTALLDRLLGRMSSSPPTRPTDPGAGTITTLLKAIVQPHIVHTDPRQSAWVAAVDAAIGEQLRTILHHPSFQALEATWRSVHDLVVNFDGDTVRVELLDISRQELLVDLRAAAGDPKATGLYALLIDRGVRLHDGQPWSLLIGDYSFETTIDDIALLATLGSLAAHAGGPFLAAATPSMLGCPSPSALADPTLWSPLSLEDQENWRALRISAVAPWLGLATPRVLLRLPYGQKTDPIEQFVFEEMPGGRDPNAYLWGNPAFVCARLIVAAFVENGWNGGLGDILELDDLPAHVYEDSGERVMQPDTETLLGERALQSILARGFMPILGHRQRNAVRLARFQSLADPPASLAGPWQPPP
jgi:type VI secretion system protein ImpC